MLAPLLLEWNILVNIFECVRRCARRRARVIVCRARRARSITARARIIVPFLFFVKIKRFDLYFPMRRVIALRLV